MKKVIYISALCIVILLGSCKKFLDERPLEAVDISNFYKTGRDITAGLAGIYLSFQTEMTGPGNNFNGKYFYWGEVRSDNFDKNGYGGSREDELRLNELTSGNALSNWDGLYRTIARCNQAIKYIPRVRETDPNTTVAVANNALAEAYAMRAMCYFYIVRLWGDAPIRLEPYENVALDPTLPREPKAKIIEEVILADLNKAYELITKNQNNTVWRISEGAIAAMLADVYMWRAGTTNNAADYTNAIGAFQKLFAAKGATGVVYGSTNANLEPTASWKQLFLAPTSTREAIWSIHWDPAANGCACLPVSIGRSNSPVRVDSVIHADWQKNTADIRVKQTYDIEQGLGNYDRVQKYYVTNAAMTSITTTADLSATYLVMYRLGDMFLLYAEALNKTGQRADALKYLNYIHQRAGLPAIAATDPSVSTNGVLDERKLETVILQERQWETFAEGKRWFDLVRTNRVNEVMDPIINDRIRRLTGTAGTEGFGTDKGRFLWPLYKTLLEENIKLEQNDSYK